MKTPERGGTGRGERALRASFARAFGGRAPAGIARAPGRINLIGEHTDYNGLPVLPFALPRAIRIAFAPRGDAAIVLRHGREGHPPREFTASPAIEPDPPGSWANYVKAAVEHFARLLLETPGASVRGFDAAVDGDIPQAGGLSSSSALVVAAALTFREVNALSMAPLEFAARCAAAERYVGTQGGGMDQAASILGAPGCALRIDFFPLAAAPVPFPEGYAVLACHSLVRAAKTEAARAEFNRRVGECRAAAALLGRAFDRPELPRLGDFAREFGTEACLRALGEAVPPDSKILARARHVFEEAERVVAAAGRVTVFQSRRWDGDFLTARRLVDEGALGTVLRMESRFERFRQEIRDAWRESGDPRDGGGQLADLGAHLIDQAIVLFGPPRTVYAEVDSRRPGAETDDDTFIALDHDGGIRSHLHMGVLAPMAGPRFRLTGLRGGVAIDGLDPQEAQLKAGLLPGSVGFGKREPGRILISGSEEREMPLLPGRYEDFYAGVASWLSGGGEAPVDPADSLRVMKVIETARASSKEREVMPFSE